MEVKRMMHTCNQSSIVAGMS